MTDCTHNVVRYSEHWLEVIFIPGVVRVVEAVVDPVREVVIVLMVCALHTEELD